MASNNKTEQKRGKSDEKLICETNIIRRKLQLAYDIQSNIAVANSSQNRKVVAATVPKVKSNEILQKDAKSLLKNIKASTFLCHEKKSNKRTNSSSIIPHDSFFPGRYSRGELPCTIEHHGTNGHFLSWICPMENLDFDYYLPIFFDGLQCKEPPLAFIARQGVEDMLYWARNHPEKVKSCLRKLILPLRNAISKNDSEIVLVVCRVIQQLTRSNCGPDLIPYMKCFLVTVRPYLDHEMNIGDSIDYSQRRHICVGEQVRLTLEALERTGGPRAFTIIKNCIPTYQSCEAL